MNKVKLLAYQLREVEERLEHAPVIVKYMLMDKYHVYVLEMLNCTDYCSIMDDICNFTQQVNSGDTLNFR